LDQHRAVDKRSIIVTDDQLADYTRAAQRAITTRPMQNNQLLRSRDDYRDDTEYLPLDGKTPPPPPTQICHAHTGRTPAVTNRCGICRPIAKLANLFLLLLLLLQLLGRYRRRGEACGAGSDSRVMGGSAHSSCQSQPSYPLNG